MTIVTIALRTDAALGECPRWQAKERKLYWVDIARYTLHRFDPATGRNETRQFDAPIGCFAFIDTGGLLLGMKDGFALLRHWDGEPEPFGDPILAGRPALRLNDGRADSHGRFWAGSVNMDKSARDAALYRLDRDGSVTLIEDGMLTCNGAAFDAGDRHFHHADTPSHMVRRYDVDPDTGTLSNRTIFHRFPNGEGRPDGGSFDAEGYYWSALFDGGRVVRLSPGGDIVQSVPLPVSRPTMIAFGGEDLRTAFVTSARTGLDEKELALQPLAGSILSFPVDVPGLPERPFRPA